MLHKYCVSFAVLMAGVLALASASASANEQQDKAAPSLSGTWQLQGGEPKIEFSGKDAMKIYPHGENQVVIVVCQYTVEKKGLVKAKIIELDGTEEGKAKAKQVIPVGLEFNFKWTAKGDVATLEDVTGKNVDPLKGHLEGKYDKK